MRATLKADFAEAQEHLERAHAELGLAVAVLKRVRGVIGRRAALGEARLRQDSGDRRIDE